MERENECLSCDLGSVSKAQSLPHSNDDEEDLKPYQSAESPLDCIFLSSDLVALTGAHSEDVPSQSYQGGSSLAEPVVENLSDNLNQEQVDRTPVTGVHIDLRIRIQECISAKTALIRRRN